MVLYRDIFSGVKSQDCLPAIWPSVTSIINATFHFAQFPIAWKIAEVTPILKDGGQEIPNNNRTISS